MSTEKKKKTYFPKVAKDNELLIESESGLQIDAPIKFSESEDMNDTEGFDEYMEDDEAPLELSETTEVAGEIGLEKSRDFAITCVELGIINKFMADTMTNGFDGIKVHSYGQTTGNGRVLYGGDLNVNRGWWYNVSIDGDDNHYIFQTLSFIDRYDRLQTYLNITADTPIPYDNYREMFDEFKEIAFNNSVYQGKCIEVEIREGQFHGIEIIDMDNVVNDLILTPIQQRYIDHFVKRLKREKTARVLFNGIPGTGKTESIRKIIEQLTPQSTFIIPRFSTLNDLRTVLESCEVFNNGVVIMDDIDLFIGSRDKGNYTNLLGEFLSFFDGVKKRKISLLASTNDKGLVDKAAERPGRFNFIIDFDYLTKEQTRAICNIHLDEEWRVDEVYDLLTGAIGGKPVKVTGAFIANLSENIKEMTEDAKEDKTDWTLKDTLMLIESSYKGFYSSQIGNKEGRVSLVG